MSAFKRYALALLSNGYSPVPLKEGEKRPLFDKWDHLRAHAMNRSEIASLIRKRPNLGLGVAGGFHCLVPVDVDTTQPAIQRAIREVLPRPKVVKMGQKGWTSFYWDESGMIEGMKLRARKGDGWDMLVEILVTGQSVLPPTIHPDTLLPYKWLTPATLFNTPIDQLSVISEAHIQDLRLALQPWMPKPEEHAPRLTYSASVRTDDKMRAYARAALRNEAQRLAALSCGRNYGLFASARKLGRFIHHNALSQSEVEKALMWATEVNGYTGAKHGGRIQAEKTLLSGLKKTSEDSLPDLAANARG